MTEPFVNGNKLQLMTELYEFSLADGYFSGGMEQLRAIKSTIRSCIFCFAARFVNVPCAEFPIPRPPIPIDFFRIARPCAARCPRRL